MIGFDHRPAKFHNMSDSGKFFIIFKVLSAQIGRTRAIQGLQRRQIDGVYINVDVNVVP